MSFELLLMRHGQAEDWATDGDSARQLTDFGQETARLVGDALRKMELAWTDVVASPFERAQQTATLVTGAAPAHTDSMLTPGAPPEETIATLYAHGEALSGDRLLAVGHNPNITTVLGQLVFGSYGVYFSVAPGDVAHLWIDGPQQNPRAAVLGYYPAKRLRLLRA